MGIECHYCQNVIKATHSSLKKEKWKIENRTKSYFLFPDQIRKIVCRDIFVMCKVCKGKTILFYQVKQKNKIYNCRSYWDEPSREK